MSDLLDELFACEPLRQAELDAFRARDVPPPALVRPDVLMRDQVVYGPPGRFEFLRYRPDAGGDAEGAIIVLERDGIGDPLDLVAWRPADDRTATWLGRAGMLGEENAAAPRLIDGLKIHRSPMSWLQCSRRGVVIVDPARARPILRNVEPLEAEDAAHMRELRSALAERPIKVVLAAGRAAA